MKWSKKSANYVCKECGKQFTIHSNYIKHVSYGHRKNKNFPQGMQKASQLLLLGLFLKLR